MTLLLNRVIALPLLAVSGIAGRVASGDLTVSLPEGDRSDEVGALVRAFRAMVENFRDQTRELVEGATVLGAAMTARVVRCTTTPVITRQLGIHRPGCSNSTVSGLGNTRALRFC